jgi:nitroreductase
MDVFDAIRTVLAVRQYRSDPIPDDVLHRILEAARLTGSASNRQPWHFIVVQDPDSIRELAALAPSGPYLAQAPAAVVVTTEPTNFGLSDASRAIQSMVLAAWEEGIGSNWVGFAGMDQIRGPLGIPEDLDVVGILPLGYPAQPGGKGRKTRKPLGEIAHRERFGQPYE